MKKKVFLWKLDQEEKETGLVEVLNTAPWYSLDEISNFLPNCAYTTLRTYQHDYTIAFEEQNKRLEDTCRLSNAEIHPDFSQIRKGIQTVIKELSNIPELRIRISIDLEKNSGDVYISAEPLITPSAVEYKNGVSAAVRTMHRNNPKAKLSSFLKSTSDLKKKLPEKFNEIIMINEKGQVLEGLSSNFFAIKDGKVWTAEEGVLSGITRSIVLEGLAALEIPVIKIGILLADLVDIDEAFITSASRSVLPLREIDDYWICKDVPGPLTQKITQKFNELLQTKLKKI